MTTNPTAAGTFHGGDGSTEQACEVQALHGLSLGLLRVSLLLLPCGDSMDEAASGSRA